MKRKASNQKSIIILFCLLFVSLLIVQCKKDGTVASTVSRALVNTPDSTIFSPFYDSTVVPYADVTPTVNDVVVAKSVLSIIKSNCVSATCHGGTGVKPYLNTYASVKSMVVPGNPEGSQLFQLITTSDLNKAMPPINYGVDLTVTEKSIIYNWIKNGAKEKPAVEDYRPAAVAIITTGCTSGNCHNQATATGAWGKSGYLGALTSADTVSFVFQNQTSGSITYYTQLKDPKLTAVWQAYKDSARKFYADTVANASFRLWKVFSTRGPLNTYDDLLFDIFYPKSIRSASGTYYVSGTKVNSKGDYLNASSSLLSRCDSTLVLANPRTKVFATSAQAGMAYSDGGLRSSDIAIIKGWYFSDPNIPNVWKYGTDGTGIFKYKKSGTIITSIQ
ncbi:hypothetical protein GALL_108220 [mine drainage metagenome]|uniref:Uncharacterized protein n=1 Tax=mine drainage metagenome TaxID=410659 RepID=A0A1J5SZ93_9ZZZZ